MTKIIMGTLLTCTLAISGGDIAPVTEDVVMAPVLTSENNSWEHSLTIYGWLPSFDGTTNYTIPGANPGDPDEEVESSFVDKIDMVFMGSYEARKNKWSFLVDAIYLKMSDAQNASSPQGRVTASAEEELDTWAVSAYGGYNILETENTHIDMIAGVRYLSLDVDVSFLRLPSVGLSREFYDAVIGLKGHVDLSENWYVPYLFDIGAGDSELTWQGEASIGYRFNWGDVLATYRYIHYEKDGSGLVQDLDMYGPKIGVVFHF
ncbi:MAG: hypothetical protein DRG09_04835 [Epsilonproteobacteria bacterium]|nr:MAG: hypothetical protein DRG09_04835 [Campylobacterota bacterium]